MEENQKQISFSTLYHKLISEDDLQHTDDNPFLFINHYLSVYASEIDTKDFQQSLRFQKELKTDANFAFECFQLEFNLLENGKSPYVNANIDFLFNQYENALNDNPLVANALIKLFAKICQPPIVTYINSNNRKRLSKWFTLKEPIKSFKLKKLPEDKWFENRFMNKFTYGFEGDMISKETSFATFKALFEGKYLENKINWVGNKSSLCYFIKRLISSKVIQNPRNKHWEIVSEFFLLNGEPIKQSELINQKVTTNKDKIHHIDHFVSSLAGYNS